MSNCTCSNFPSSLGNITIGVSLGVGTTTSPATPLDVVGTATVRGTAFVDGNGQNTGSAQPGLAFGASNSGEGIASKRNSGGNQFGLDFYTNYTRRMSLDATAISGLAHRHP